MRQGINWVLLMILLLGFLILFFVIVGFNIPRTTAEKLTYIIKVIWGVVP